MSFALNWSCLALSNLPLGNSSWSWCTSTGTSPLRRRSSCCGRACQLIHIGHSPVSQTSSFQVLKMVSVESLWFSFNYVTCTNHNKKVIILTFSSTIRVHSLSPPTPEVPHLASSVPLQGLWHAAAGDTVDPPSSLGRLLLLESSNMISSSWPLKHLAHTEVHLKSWRTKD